MKSARYLDESMRKIKDRGNIHGAEKIAVMAALNITHDMLRKSRQINETRHMTDQQVKGLEDRIDEALAESRQLEIWTLPLLINIRSKVHKLRHSPVMHLS